MLAGKSSARVVRQREILYGVKKRDAEGGEMEIERLPRKSNTFIGCDRFGWLMANWGKMMGNNMSLEELATCVSVHVCAHVSP